MGDPNLANYSAELRSKLAELEAELAEGGFLSPTDYVLEKFLTVGLQITVTLSILYLAFISCSVKFDAIYVHSLRQHVPFETKNTYRSPKMFNT